MTRQSHGPTTAKSASLSSSAGSALDKVKATSHCTVISVVICANAATTLVSFEKAVAAQRCACVTRDDRSVKEYAVVNNSCDR